MPLTAEILAAASAQAEPAAAAAVAVAETVLGEAEISRRRCVKQIERCAPGAPEVRSVDTCHHVVIPCLPMRATVKTSRLRNWFIKRNRSTSKVTV